MIVHLPPVEDAEFTAALIASAADRAVPALLEFSPDKPSEFQYIETTAGRAMAAPSREAAIRAFDRAARLPDEVTRIPAHMFSERAMQSLTKLAARRRAAGYADDLGHLVAEALRHFCHQLEQKAKQ